MQIRDTAKSTKWVFHDTYDSILMPFQHKQSLFIHAFVE